MISGKNIIVTGGAGFIGSNLVEMLAKDNKVYIIDNMHTGSEENVQQYIKGNNAEFIKDDAKNLNKHNIDADMLFHLGIYSASPMYRENPHLVAEVVDGMVSMLEYAKANSVPLVFASTSSIYNGIKPPHSENVVPGVTDYYTEARIAAERMAELYSKLHDVNVSAMRFFSVYGRHERSKKGYANLATQFLWAMQKGEQPVIYGNGEQRRDFVYAEDVAMALIGAMEHAKGYNVYNVGTGKNYSLNELTAKLNEKMGKDIKPKYVEMPVKNYVMETLADTSKAEKEIGFKAATQLDQGLDKIMEYYSQ